MNFAAIMAGGTGSRFWPLSRLALPKQLLPIGDERTLLELTVERLAPLVEGERLLVVTGDAIAARIAEAMPTLPAANLVAEPLRRNTAPCAAVAAKLALDRDPEAVIALLPADHLIAKVDEFRDILRAAYAEAAKGRDLITLGITPTHAETGYGYIEVGPPAGESGGRPFHRVTAFHEKPAPARAEAFLAAGNYLWNAGIFVFQARAFLEAVAATLPELAAAVARVDGRAGAAAQKAAVDAIYPGLKGVSVDVGVMEKVENLLVFPADIGWSDVGSWTAMRDLYERDAADNVAHGEYIAIGGGHNTVYAAGGVVVTVGVEGMIVVHTPDATLVARRDDAQAVKKVFDELERRGWTKYL